MSMLKKGNQLAVPTGQPERVVPAASVLDDLDQGLHVLVIVFCEQPRPRITGAHQRAGRGHVQTRSGTPDGHVLSRLRSVSERANTSGKIFRSTCCASMIAKQQPPNHNQLKTLISFRARH